MCPASLTSALNATSEKNILFFTKENVTQTVQNVPTKMHTNAILVTKNARLVPLIVEVPVLPAMVVSPISLSSLETPV